MGKKKSTSLRSVIIFFSYNKVANKPGHPHMLPPALVHLTNRLAGFSTNHVRLEAQGSRSGIGANQQIRFTLPSNALINLKSFAVHFTARTSATPNTVASRLPPDAKSLFDRVEVSIGGVHLTQGANYVNILTYVRNAALGKREDVLVGHGEMVRKNAYTESGEVGLFENTPVVARGFVGFMDSDTILDTSLCGDMVVTLHTAGNEIISCSGDPGSVGAMTSDIDGSSGSYLINDLFAQYFLTYRTCHRFAPSMGLSLAVVSFPPKLVLTVTVPWHCSPRGFALLLGETHL